MSKLRGRFKTAVKDVAKTGIKALGGTPKALGGATKAAADLVYDARKTYVLFFGDVAPRENAGPETRIIDLKGTGYKLKLTYQRAGKSRDRETSAQFLIEKISVVDALSPNKEYKTEISPALNAKGVAAPVLLRVTAPKVKASGLLVPVKVDVLASMNTEGDPAKNAPIFLPRRGQTIGKGTPLPSRVLPKIQRDFNLTQKVGTSDPVALEFVGDLRNKIAAMKAKDLFGYKKDIWMVVGGKNPRYMTVDKQQSMYYRIMKQFAHAVFEAVVNEHNQKANHRPAHFIATSMAASSSSDAGPEAPVYDEEEGVIYTDPDRDVPLGVFSDVVGESGVPIAGVFSKFTKKGRANARARKTEVRGRRYFLIKTDGSSEAELNYFDPEQGETASGPGLNFKVTRRKRSEKWAFASFTLKNAKSGTVAAQGYYTPALIAVDRIPTDKKKRAKVLLFNTSRDSLNITGGPRAQSDAVANVLLKQIRKAAFKDEEAFVAAAQKAAQEHGKYKSDSAKRDALNLRVRDKIEYAPPAFAALGPQ